jgi:hypothetical protein
MLINVSFFIAVDVLISGQKAITMGLADTAVKNENGARLKLPS